MHTLVLDVGMQPVERLPWQKAIVKVVVDRTARVIEEYPDRYINTVNWSIKMPSVVMLVKPVSRKKAVKFSRHAVFARDRGRCQYCGTKMRTSDLTYDHVVPRSQGGQTRWENVVACCTPCNQRKAGRTPAQAGMRLLSTPIKPKKLPEAPREMQWMPGDPESWKDWLRSSAYWNAELEHDE